MARGQKALQGAAPRASSSGAGHNIAPITESEWQAAVSRLKAKHRELDAHNTTGKAIKNDIKAITDELKNKFQIPKAMVKRVLADAMKTHVDLEREAILESRLREWLNLPTGQQGELFSAPVLDPAAASALWEEQGVTAGLLGADPVAPDGCPPEHIQDWLRGRDRGQAKLAEGLAPKGRA